MFYLIRAKTATSSISIARGNEPAEITSTILDLQLAGFANISILDASGKEVALSEIDLETPIAQKSPATSPSAIRP